MTDMEYNRNELEQKVLDSAEQEAYVKALNTAAEERRKILAKGISTAELESALGTLEELRVKVFRRQCTAKTAAVKKTLKKPAKKTASHTAEVRVNPGSEA